MLEADLANDTTLFDKAYAVACAQLFDRLWNYNAAIEYNRGVAMGAQSTTP